MTIDTQTHGGLLTTIVRRRLGRFWDAVGGGDGTMTAADVYDPVLPNLVERNILYANVNAGFNSAVNRRVESIFYANATTRWTG